MIKVLSLFSGIGSPEQALKNLGIKFELVGFSEIDKFAIKSFCSVHNVDESLNLGDITKINIKSLPIDIDLITHGSPCQDFSVAGKGHGGIEGSGTRSSLMWNTVQIVEHCKPKIVIWENVKNVISKKHKDTFDKYIDKMDSLGYKNYYKVLNAKHYGVPQNRERIFVISIRKDVNIDFTFPEPFDNGLRLIDILENNVDEKFYINTGKAKNLIEKFKTTHEKQLNKKVSDTNRLLQISLLGESGFKHTRIVYDKLGVSPTLDTMQGGGKTPKILCEQRVDEGLRFFKDGVCGSLRTISNHNASRVIDVNGICPTVMENHGTVTGVLVSNKK